MKFSATDWSFYSKAADSAKYYETLKSIGYDGVEMVDPSRWDQARKAGMEIINLSGPGMQQGVNRKERHAELLPEIRDNIALAGDNNIPYVIVFSGNREGQPDDEGISNCQCAFEQLLPDAEKHGVTLLFEMLNSLDHVDYQADSGDFGFKLAGKMNSPYFKLIYDIFHMERMGKQSADEVVANLDLIGHIHLAEAPGRGIPLADGNIKYAKIVPEIVSAGYDGYWGMEFMPSGESISELETAKNLFQRLEK
jgi:hydroxypyruvate isomerase